MVVTGGGFDKGGFEEAAPEDWSDAVAAGGAELGGDVLGTDEEVEVEAVEEAVDDGGASEEDFFGHCSPPA